MPRIEVTERTLYKYNELSDDAKSKARDWWRDCENQDNDFADCVIDGPVVDAAKMLGITFATRPVKLMGGGTRYDPRIYWSLHTQGSGACFEGEYQFTPDSAAKVAAEYPTDEKLQAIATSLDAAQAESAGAVYANVSHRGNYTHEHSATIGVYFCETDEEAPEATADAVAEALRDFMRWIHSAIESEYDYRMSDENVIESIEANEYEFTETGRIA